MSDTTKEIAIFQMRQRTERKSGVLGGIKCKRYKILFLLFISILFLIAPHSLFGAELKPIVINPSYDHNKWGITPYDQIFKFAAYISSFDGADDNDSDSDKWGIPEWAAFEIKKVDHESHLEKRPKWMTDKKLYMPYPPNSAGYHRDIGQTTPLNLYNVKEKYRKCL